MVRCEGNSRKEELANKERWEERWKEIFSSLLLKYPVSSSPHCAKQPYGGSTHPTQLFKKCDQRRIHRFSGHLMAKDDNDMSNNSLGSRAVVTPK